MVVKREKHIVGPFVREYVHVEFAKTDKETGKIFRHEFTDEDKNIFRELLRGATPQGRIGKLLDLADLYGVGKNSLEKAEKFIQKNGLKTREDLDIFNAFLAKAERDIERKATEDDLVPSVIRDTQRQAGTSKGGKQPKRLKFLEDYLQEQLEENSNRTADYIWRQLKKNRDEDELSIDGDKLWQRLGEKVKSIKRATFNDYVKRARKKILENN